MKKITIVGGGASGTLLAVNLMKHCSDRELAITMVEDRSRIGRGVAFGTVYDTHLLNVPAGRMGAFPDDIEHFYRWLDENGYNYGPNDFVPRVLFGNYLHDLLERSSAAVSPNIRFSIVDDEACDLTVNSTAAEVICRSGQVLPSHKVVLAFGNFKPPHPNVDDLSFISSDMYFQDPWKSALYENVRPDATIFVIGTGLSMVDVALHFNRQGHRGKIIAISTRGLLPAAHKLGYTYPSFNDEIRGMTRITEILKVVRRHINAAETTGSNWRAVIDSLRPETQQIWMGLPVAEKRYFIQHLSRYWNVARHRMPAEAAAVLEEMAKRSQLEILKGRLRSINPDDEGRFDIEYSLIGERHSTSADAIVNCIGSETNINRIDSPFVRKLIDRGHIRSDELSMGIDASKDGAIVDKNGEHSQTVFTLGTALKGRLWETTAIPEIRTQARDLALRLLAD